MKIAAILTAGILMVSFAWADGTSSSAAALARGDSSKPISILLAQKKVIKDAKGSEQLVDAAAVKPADIIEYRVTYTNVSNKPVRGVVAELPIPEGLEYQALSAKPVGNVLLAAKDVAYAKEPLVRKRADGKLEPVPYTEYRRVRWALGVMAPGAVVDVYARAKVEDFGDKSQKASGAAKSSGS
ncbi:hypothetical protein LG204_06555 [Methylovorus menthalis]|uniref:hypothetical protein n=1 Tax=Methylovorus menthalis TaxID=1002227 RepID=UPI001E57EFBE|nr:hypothetical protein [Methylovorus menthalis]MCB4810972.1 hypothetical protein [Methylovorus menthalis]